MTKNDTCVPTNSNNHANVAASVLNLAHPKLHVEHPTLRQINKKVSKQKDSVTSDALIFRPTHNTISRAT